jgi:ferredoxin-NADP reductase/MOSC domain-containing protein YiiM
LATLVSVNIGLPKDVAWQGKTVRTGIFKVPVEGRVMARRLNLDGDGQGDLNGHGGENRAVMVYQSESYDYWRAQLSRDDLTPGALGENFTVSGLSDDAVCIGDRYRIGAAEFEVTQPRVTCYRVGMRLGEPDMPRLLVAHHRPGFYFRVITEGDVGAGDPIVQTRRGRHHLSVADVDALLYLPGADPARLREAVDVPALSPGWQQSFHELLSPKPVTTKTVAWPGFRTLRITATHRETPDVLSIELAADEPLPPPAAGQYLTLRVLGAAEPAPLRSYSLSGDPTAGTYRISVKREAHGQVSRWLHENARAGGTVEVAAPRGEFCLGADNDPVVLLSAGIGATPVLAMLHQLSSAAATRRIIWIHTTRDRASHAFADEVSTLIDALPDAEQHTVYTVTSGNRLDRDGLAAFKLPANSGVYLCGPDAFMDAMRDTLIELGITSSAIHTELFGARSPINPGVVGAGPAVPPHPPAGQPGTGPPVTFARSGLTVAWSPQYGSLLEFSEACDVPTRYSCRSGVCHICETAVMAGTVDYLTAPLEPPTEGSILICCSAPRTELILDL